MVCLIANGRAAVAMVTISVRERTLLTNFCDADIFENA